eukprot:NODE_7198_length_243_cov_34.634021_g7115_i0.p2 GENE.NODE_7198_length_243_cov_34.634021_g7115_i0~~NODE_7198_length_243_cov_34.634021_g7115_i0.p2  ORF type:complete len:55 (-),score=15.21 NODE_7198_length_243_cov_34.634021_g7115_i0:77-217(-)
MGCVFGFLALYQICACVCISLCTTPAFTFVFCAVVFCQQCSKRTYF